MSVNIGTPAVDAARALRENEHWRTIRVAMLMLVQARMNSTLETPADRLADAVGYTRALRDLHVAFESATTGVPYNVVKKPGPEKT